MLIPSSIPSKPSFRKHSSFEKLFDGEQAYQHLLERQHFSLGFNSLAPSSPSKKMKPNIYTCICFFFFIVTMVAYLRCSSLDGHGRSSSSSDAGPNLRTTAALERSFASLSAFKGLGSIYRIGTKAMNELVVAHVTETTSLRDMRMFLRTLYRSGIASRADIVFLFPWNSLPFSMVDVITQEYRYFDKLAHKFLKDHTKVPIYEGNSSSSSLVTSSTASKMPVISSSFGVITSRRDLTLSPFRGIKRLDLEEDSRNIALPFWGTRNSNPSKPNQTEGISNLHHYGSIVGFGVSELNPDNALQGFINHPPLALRRWACYQMLLGMVRRKFKHVLLTDVSGVVMLRDPFNIIGKRRSGLYVTLEDRAWGSSFTQELGTSLNALDMEVGIQSNDAIVLHSATNVSIGRRQLNSRPDKASFESLDDKSESVQTVVLDEKNKVEGKSESTYSRSQRGSWRKPVRHQMDAHRKGGIGRRKKSRRGSSSPAGGLYERVYGRTMWSSLGENERKMKLVNSAVMMGSMHQVRGLANTMVTEIVKVALERRNREAFPDSVLLSYLLHKSSSLLGKKVLDHLHLMSNANSFVHSLVGSEQPSVFLKGSNGAYSVIHGNNKSKRWGNVIYAIQRDICSSLVDAMVYMDCSGHR
ncbi:hypothetical protein KP509_02G078500 [Ceratopteris richardii]|nr:hypothetical protein KP509_02G078500 [Ceratopteris richardii]